MTDTRLHMCEGHSNDILAISLAFFPKEVYYTTFVFLNGLSYLCFIYQEFILSGGKDCHLKVWKAALDPRPSVCVASMNNLSVIRCIVVSTS